MIPESRSQRVALLHEHAERCRGVGGSDLSLPESVRYDIRERDEFTKAGTQLWARASPEAHDPPRHELARSFEALRDPGRERIGRLVQMHANKREEIDSIGAGMICARSGRCRGRAMRATRPIRRTG